MAKKAFNLIEWFHQKIKEEKATIDYLSDKLFNLTEEIKKGLNELKDDSHHLVPIINGLHGDEMEKKGHPALVKMSVRFKSRDIPPGKIKDFIDLKKHGGKLILFLHGLMNDETIWQSEKKDTLKRLGTFIESQNKANVLYIRYNTGRHISENGRNLSCLLELIEDLYENDIVEINIIAHSMGGLVTRSAGHYATVLNHNWIKKLKKVFLIGVPNDGSYLARTAYMAQYFLRKLDPTKHDEYARLFDIRSNGIKDLSFGFMVDEDWMDPLFEKQKSRKATKIYPLTGVDYYLIAATVADQNQKNKFFTFFGDGLVEKESALSNLFKENVVDSGYIHFGYFPEENHLTLLESEKVQEYLLKGLEWKIL